jgi:hypothetical protein
MSSAEVHIQAKAHVAGALNAFPTKWSPEVQTNEEDFNKILRELGRVTVAYNRLDQEIFDALSFLLAGPNPATADYAIAAKATNAVKGFEARRNLILSIYEERKPVPAKRQELDQILKACVAQHDNRNIFLHSRWALPEKGSTAAAVRAKFQQGKDKYEDVTLGQLEKLVRDIEECTTRLRDFFSEGAAFSDYWQWIANRVFD